MLESLDISFNYFAYEENIEPLVYLPRLLTVMLYGNPVLGPTGEDPSFIYIEDTIDKAAAVRDAMKSAIPDIEVCVIEITFKTFVTFNTNFATVVHYGSTKEENFEERSAVR